MLHPIRRSALAGALLLATCLATPARSQDRLQARGPVITVQGQSFDTWQEYTSSAVFQQLGLRCGSPTDVPEQRGVPGDCGASSTTISREYEATTLIEIPVVVHILEHSNGSGQISDAQVQSQIDILNQDFQALAGSPGANGNAGMVQFYLAQFDPGGLLTTGITRTVNNNWYNDIGNYWDDLAWDPNVYLNIYTNQASGALGYVPALPQGGIVGSNSDRVVCLWSAFGLNAPIGPPYNKGRTATHEVGHYFGLYHTFQGGCAAASNCYNNGDYICDTNPEQSPTFGCPASKSSCGSSDPFDNYMDYSDDLCMEEFTVEQVNRMRCTLENWRPDLAQPACPPASVAWRNAGSNLDVFTSNDPVMGTSWVASIDTSSTGYTDALLIGYALPDSLDLGAGKIVLVDLASPLYINMSSAGPLAQFTIPIPVAPVLCGFPIYTQAALLGGAPGFVLTNSQDLTIGL